ncbi:MAG: sodium:solute symporter family protein [Gammaproteobacteria bacterium]
MSIDLVIICLFLAINLVIGLACSKNINDLNQFSVGHRAFGSFAIYASLTASFIGGGYTLGNAAKVQQYGLIYACALLGFSLKEIFVALWIAPRMHAFHDCLSVGDIIGKCYGKSAKFFTGIFSLLICAGILGAQVGALNAIFSTFFELNALWGVLISFGIIIIYASLGGMRAVVYTDILQFIILMIGVPLTFFVGLHVIGGWPKIVATVPSTHLFFLNNLSDFARFAALFIAFMLGEALVPPYVQRLFMTKTTQQTKRATLASGLTSIPFFLIAGAIGLVAYVLNPNLPDNQAFPYVVQHTLSPALRGLVIASIVAIIMSSAAGFLNAAAVAFTNDLIQPIWGNKLTSKQLLNFAKLSTFIVGIIAIVFALMINNVLDILLSSYQFWAPIILVPLLAAIFQWPVSKQHFLAGAMGGITAVGFWQFVLNNPYAINSLIIGVLANAVCFAASIGLTKNLEQRNKNARKTRAYIE